ncbi:radical SAM family heme chaperone HemW [Phenylobacterium sp.]|uniref:radical SAM family heme chaperone HemW n=1 Tax=Phenylobacterium sp. TaxID=1871053 RepID=UPI0025FB1664|nr:radical SAM family heme chaperone HemW [Phenylobacterium sp.]MCA3720973.1 coproporphyrinogen III oxidase [Phenylobacterium sp.]
MTDDAAAPGFGVYVHWPYCGRICPYCDFNVHRDRRPGEAARLAQAILQDLARRREVTGPRRLTSIFFGGGTPSLMDPEAVGAVIAACRTLWDADPDLEVSLEANPTDAEAGRFAGLAEAGVNRLSLGLQSLEDEALVQLGRNHDAAAGRRATQTALKVFSRVSIDLIYARPDQTPQAWAAELDAAVALGTGHVSPYQLTIEPGTAFERAVRRGRLRPPADPQAADLWGVTQDRLSAAGFEAYEVSNHARSPADRSRHNLTYWRGGDWLGVGPGAHGRLTLDGVRTGQACAARPADYIAAADRGEGAGEIEVLSPRDAAVERVLSGLRLAEGVDFGALDALGLSAGHAEVRELASQGLLAEDPRRLRVTDDGRRLLDAVLERLLAR